MRGFNLFLLFALLCLVSIDARQASHRLRSLREHKHTAKHEAITLDGVKTVHDMASPQVNGLWDARRTIKHTKAQHKIDSRLANQDYNNKRGQAIQQHKANMKPLNQAKHDAITSVRAKSAHDRANNVPRAQRDRNAHHTVVKAGDNVRNQNRQHKDNLKNMDTQYRREKQARDSDAKGKILAASNASLMSKMVYKSDGTNRIKNAFRHNKKK